VPGALSESIQAVTPQAPVWQHHGQVDIQVGHDVFPALIRQGSKRGMLQLTFFDEDVPYLMASLGQSIQDCALGEVLLKVPAARVGHLEFTLSTDQKAGLWPHWVEETPKLGPCQQPIRIEYQLLHKPCQDLTQDVFTAQVFVQKPIMIVFNQFDQRSEISTIRAFLNHQGVAVDLHLSSNFFLQELFQHPLVWQGILHPSGFESMQIDAGTQGQAHIQAQTELLGLSVQITLMGDLLACSPYEVRQQTQQPKERHQENLQQNFFSQLLKMDRWSWAFRQGVLAIGADSPGWGDASIPIQMDAEHGLCIGPWPSYDLGDVTGQWPVLSDFEQAIESLGDLFFQLRKPQESLNDLSVCVSVEMEIRRTHVPLMRLGWHCVFKAQDEKLFELRLKSRTQIQETIQHFGQLMAFIHSVFDQQKIIFINHLLHDPGALIIFIKKYYHLDALKNAIMGRVNASEPHPVLVGALCCLLNHDENDTACQTALKTHHEEGGASLPGVMQSDDITAIDQLKPDEVFGQDTKEAASIETSAEITIQDSVVSDSDRTFKPWIVHKQNGEVKLLWPLDQGVDAYQVYLRSSPVVPIQHCVVLAEDASKGLVISNHSVEDFQVLPHVIWCSIYSSAQQATNLKLDPVFVYIPTLQVERWFSQDRLLGWQWKKPNFSVLYYSVTVSAIDSDTAQLIASARLEPDIRQYDLTELQGLLLPKKTYQMRIKAKIFEQPGAYAWTPVTCFDFVVH